MTWTLANNATAGDRLLNVGQALLHLSTGDAVMLVNDPNVADPNSISVQLIPGPAHTTPQIIATPSAGVFGPPVGGTFWTADTPGALQIVLDDFDNIYFIGTYAGTTGQGIRLAYQAFVKGVGLTWTAQAPNTVSQSLTGTSNINDIAAVWCRTGGGTPTPGSGGLPAGHILVAGTRNSGGPIAWILDAGLIQKSSAQLGTLIIAPNFLHQATGGAMLDLSPDGFGATTGLSIQTSNGPGMLIGVWGVSGAGTLTTAYGLLSGGPVTVAGKVRVANIAANRWAAVCEAGSDFPATPTALVVALYGIGAGTAGFIGQLTLPTTSNFPTPGATLSWDVVAAQDGVWVYAWSSATPTTLLRQQVTFPSDVPTLGLTGTAIVTSDATGVGTGTPTTIRVVRDPVDFLHIDWTINGIVSTNPALIGGFSVLPLPANIPALLTPLANVALALATTTNTFTWLFSSPQSGEIQLNYYFKRQASGGVAQWWTGSTWSTSETAVTSANQFLTLTSTQWNLVGGAANTVYTWSVQTSGAGGGGPSGYAPAQVVVSGGALPTVPSMTVSYDAVNNRVQLVCAGTGTDIIQINYSDDGGVTWLVLRASLLAPILLAAGAATVFDYEAGPGVARLYRALQFDSSQGIFAVMSAWSTDPTDTVTAVVTVFWLRDPTLLSSGMHIDTLPGSFAPELDENVTQYAGLGRQDPIILADVMPLPAGAATFVTYDAAYAANLLAMLRQQKTLLVQTTDNQNLYVRIYGTRGPWNQPTPVRPGSYKEYPVTWVGQNRP